MYVLDRAGRAGAAATRRWPQEDERDGHGRPCGPCLARPHDGCCVRLVSILGDAFEHAGQAAYLRGVLDRTAR